MAKRIKAANMKFLLDFHYSDTWADPEKQCKSAAWKKRKGAFIWEPLNTWEYIFEKQRSIDSLLNIYLAIAKKHHTR